MLHKIKNRNNGKYGGRFKTVRKLSGIFMVTFSIIAGIYFGLWVMFIQPIIGACASFDAGTLSATMIAITILKCLIGPSVVTLVSYFLFFLGIKIYPFD